jgi:Kinetochore complex Sim4 subunit Fta1
MDWYHTWSVHLVMKTLSTLTPSATNKGKKRRHDYVTNLCSISKQELERSATDHLRRYTEQRQQSHKKQRRTCRSTTNNRINHEEFVRILWIGNDDMTSKRHLYVEVRLQDVFSASVIFCYYKNETSNNHNTATIDSFDFCLARGLRSSYETIFAWIATLTDGILFVGMTPCQFNTNDLSYLLSSWITIEYHQPLANESIGAISVRNAVAIGDEPSTSLSVKNTKISLPPRSFAKDTARQLALTFKTPSTIATAGLDTIALTVPSDALWELYIKICDNEPACLKKLHQATSFTCPMVRAIQCFVEEAFAIDTSSFPLIKIVTTFATVGSDGRYKPTENAILYTPKTLPDIRRLVEHAKETMNTQSRS